MKVRPWLIVIPGGATLISIGMHCFLSSRALVRGDIDFQMHCLCLSAVPRPARHGSPSSAFSYYHEEAIPEVPCEVRGSAVSLSLHMALLLSAAAVTAPLTSR